ncbi:MAG: hypothetical protein JOY54_10245 [Acidobacteriaceae bacterium]|nr:hypothetical protein [Acidobacteriaceae bacterium]
MNDHARLREILARLAVAQPREASPDTEERILAAFRARRRRLRPAWAYWASAAACLALGFGWFWMYHPAQSPVTAATANESYHSATAGFVALPYAQSDVPMEEAIIVRVTLQPSELRVLGAPIIVRKATGRINADLLVGQDGVARAVRVVE